MEALRVSTQNKLIETFSKDFDKKTLVSIEKNVYLKNKGEKEYKKAIYEIFGCLHYVLENFPNAKIEYIEKLSKSIQNGEVGWKSAIYDSLKEKNRDIILAPLQEESRLEKCEFPCRNPKCRSNQCYIFSLQTRSIDEGMTNLLICKICGGRFKIS